jgi:N-alpha-acetyltransferase 40
VFSYEQRTSLIHILNVQDLQLSNIMPQKLVESINSLSSPVFFSQFYSAFELQMTLRKGFVMTGADEIRSTNIAGLKRRLEQCLELIEATSAADYRASGMGWHPAKKRREMLLPDMRYIMLFDNKKDPTPGSDLPLAGFVSFMITSEDGHEVIYCYEIHLVEQWRGKGFGKKLMSIVEHIGRKAGMEKSMLTVFKTNSRAIEMYQHMGYVEDEFSPEPRLLRNGTVKEPKYVILSKPLRSAA